MNKFKVLMIAFLLVAASCGGNDDSGEDTTSSVSDGDSGSDDGAARTTCDPAVKEASHECVQIATYALLDDNQAIEKRKEGWSWLSAPIPGAAVCNTLNNEDNEPENDMPAAWVVLEEGEEAIQDRVLAWLQGLADDPDSTAGLNYILPTAMGYGVFPADNPSAAGDIPSVRLGEARDGVDVTIYVADTGYSEPPADYPLANLEEGVGGRESIPKQTNDPSTGHGLMVGSVAALKAPGATVIVINATAPLDSEGKGQPFISVSSLAEAIKPDGGVAKPAVLNMSFGTLPCDFEEIAEGGNDAFRADVDAQIARIDGVSTIADLAVLSMNGLRTVMSDAESQYDLLVAAAGNMGPDSADFFPAALADEFPTLVAVGARDDTVPNTKECFEAGHFAWMVESTVEACDPNDRVADFSRNADWIGSWAPGVDMVAAYPDALEFEYYDGSVAMPGPLVRISGTSMATPYISAVLATCLSGWGPSEINETDITDCLVDFQIPSGS